MNKRYLGALVATSALLLLAPGQAAAVPVSGTAESVPTARAASPALAPSEGEAFTIVAHRKAAPGQRAAVITCTGSFNGRPYDHPHPGKSSNRRAINAHLAITCTGTGAGLTHVTVTSRMVDGRRAGAPDTDRGFRSARTGGDLRCVSQKRRYQAKGSIFIKFPPRYTPATATGSPVSVIKAFKRGPGGKCIRP